MDESTKTLRECNELLKFFGSFKNPILEQKEATLKRLKEEWDEFKDKIEESAAGMCTCLILSECTTVMLI